QIKQLDLLKEEIGKLEAAKAAGQASRYGAGIDEAVLERLRQKLALVTQEVSVGALAWAEYANKLNAAAGVMGSAATEEEKLAAREATITAARAAGTISAEQEARAIGKAREE